MIIQINYTTESMDHTLIGGFSAYEKKVEIKRIKNQGGKNISITKIKVR